MTNVKFSTPLYASIVSNINHPLFGLNQIALGTLQGNFENKGGFVTIKNVTDYDLFDVTSAKGVVAFGGEIENYPIFLRMTQEKWNSDVPSGISYRSYYDEESEQEVVKEWSEWTTVDHIEPTGTTDVAVPLHQNGADYIPASQWATLDGVSGYSLLTQNEYRALTPEIEE